MIKEFKSLKKNFLICDFNSAFQNLKIKWILYYVKIRIIILKKKIEPIF